jgi:hypothetical protein
MVCRFYDQISSVVHLVSGQVPFWSWVTSLMDWTCLLQRTHPAYRPQSSYSPAVRHKYWWHHILVDMKTLQLLHRILFCKTSVVNGETFLSHCPYSFISKNVKTQISMGNWLQTTFSIKKATVKWDHMSHMGWSREGTIYNQCNMTIVTSQWSVYEKVNRFLHCH